MQGFFSRTGTITFGIVMVNLKKDCEMLILSEEQRITNFDCGNADLNDFFNHENDFIPVFSTEEQEKEAYRQLPSEILRTRYMFFDMIHWRDKMM
jgi:hypothetical protein